MEYGLRSLGNRSILYHAKDSEVNLCLITQLNRTELMPFAPATPCVQRESCYPKLHSAERAATFMTIIFDCSEQMKQQSPTVVHVDGNTAEPQLIGSEFNPDFHRLLTEYYWLTGVPSVITTIFNMHEEPMIYSPIHAVRAFQFGSLPYLAIGAFPVSASPLAAR